MAATKKRPKYTADELAIRDAARTISEAGKRPLANPIRSAQVRLYLRATNGTAADPFSEGGPLAGMKVADAKKVAREGGRGVSTRCVSAWRKAHSRTIRSSALDNNRVVVCLALAAQRAAS